jgi:RNA polymerase sigma-70 factor (ECF subfamily)
MTASEFQFKLIDLQDSLMKFAYSLTANSDDAKDLVQETMLKALNNSDKYVVESNFKAWTYTILKNTFINDYRRVSRQNIYRDLAEESVNSTKSVTAGTDNPDSEYLVLEITQNIEKLKDMFRIPLKMHLYGYKYKEIADKLHLNIGTVKSRISLSKKHLMDRLEA